MQNVDVVFVIAGGDILLWSAYEAKRDFERQYLREIAGAVDVIQWVTDPSCYL
jgi:hypothetical protein